VNQHRSAEVSLSEHLRDMVKVVPNLIAALGIPNVVRANVNRSSVVVKFEVMCSFLVREPHHMIPVLVDRGLVIL
jgi:hypothetical protein